MAMLKTLTTLEPSLADTNTKGSRCLSAKANFLLVTCRGPGRAGAAAGQC